MTVRIVAACERASASAACVAERNCGAAKGGLRGRGTK